MRRVLLPVIVVGTCLISQVSRAEFAIKAANQAVTANLGSSSGVVADQPHVDPGDGHAAGQVASAKRPRLVLGFGDQVPLSFACRQIIPRGVRVLYGPGASPDALVDWKGGDVWPLVLGRAIHPLGLHMVAVGTKLTIKH